MPLPTLILFRSLQPPSPARAPACPICVRPLSFCETLFAPHCGYLCHLACMQLVVQGDLRGDKPSNPRLRAVRCPICHSRHPMAACVDGGLEKTPPGKAHLKSDFPKDAQPGRESSRGGGLYEPGFPPDPRLRGPRTGGVPENRAPKSPPGTSHAAPAKPPKLNSRILKSAPSSMSSCGGPVGRPSGPPQNMTGPRPNPPLVKAPPSPQVLRRTQSLGDASEFFEALELSRLREVDKGDPAGALARPGVAPSDARYRVQYAPPPGLLDAQISGRCKCGCRAAAQNVGGRVKVVAHNEAGRTMDAIYWSHVANSRGHSPASTALARTKSM